MRALLAGLFGLEVLAYAVWIGSIVAVAVAAPTLFQTLESRDLAGRAFGAILTRLFPVMYACGVAILLAGLVDSLLGGRLGSIEAARYGIVAAMLAITVYAGTAVLGEMRSIQAALPGPIETLPLESGPRARFETLHKTSERLIGGVAVLGVLMLPLLLAGRNRP